MKRILHIIKNKAMHSFGKEQMMKEVKLETQLFILDTVDGSLSEDVVFLAETPQDVVALIQRRSMETGIKVWETTRTGLVTIN